jgi:hypothetical protein
LVEISHNRTVFHYLTPLKKGLRMQTFTLVLIATAAFAGVACFFAYGVRKMETVDRLSKNPSSANDVGLSYVPMAYGGFSGGDSGSAASCGDGGGGCS